jgi:hypothetical protein
VIEYDDDTRWLCVECFNEGKNMDKHLCHYPDEWYPNHAELRECDGCGDIVDCIPCEPTNL